MRSVNGSKENGFMFSRMLVGVEFNPYVRLLDGGQAPPLDSYTLPEIKYMLKLISTRFTNVTTESVGVNGNHLVLSISLGLLH